MGNIKVEIPEDFFDDLVFLPIQEEIEAVVINAKNKHLYPEEASFKIMEIFRDYLQKQKK